MLQCFLYVDIFFRWYFEIIHAVLFCHLSSFTFAYHPLLRQICFIPDENLRNGRICMLIYTTHPCFYVFKRFLVCQVKCNYYSVSLLVELISNSLKSFLPRCVPYFNVKFLFTILILALDKINTYNEYKSFSTYNNWMIAAYDTFGPWIDKTK